MRYFVLSFLVHRKASLLLVLSVSYHVCQED